DLDEFRLHGGKLILWHGFADPRVPTLSTIAYYERLITSQTREGRHDEGERKEGLRRTQEFARLFLSPGVGHCGPGPGPDGLGSALPSAIAAEAGRHHALQAWVEHGIAPEQLIAAKVTNGATVFTRPVCPYPALPRYHGAGDP